MEDSGQSITLLLRKWGDGDSDALRHLFPLIYSELKRIAARQLAQESWAGRTRPTVLVNELYLKLAASHGAPVEDRAHFYGLAARALRQILTDRARSRARQCREGIAVELDAATLAAPQPADHPDLESLDAALERLHARDARAARIVELRFFAGLSIPETASITGLSPATVKREWAVARLFLLREMEKRGA